MQSHLSHEPAHRLKHDSAYEIKTLVLLGLGFGLVGLDRWIVAPLFPHMMRDLNLNFQQLGSLIGILSVAWGIWAIAMGSVSDRIGRKKILVVSMVAFSLLSSLSGLASGFASLMLIRAVMGVAEGAFTPASVAATGEASLPSRRGFNQGLQLSMFSLLGLGFAPILATQLLRIVPSWHWVFMISAVPGLIVAVLISRVLRDKPKSELQGPASAQARPRWTGLFGSRNVWLAMLAILCAMSGIFVVSAMVPTYLVEVLHLDTQQMGFVVSAIGFGGFVGSFGVAGISDSIGRRNAALIAFIGAAVFLYLFARTGANQLALFGLLFGVSVFALGLLGLLSGPIATEAAPAGLVASSIGFVSGAGEIFGGGLAPAVAGFVAQHFGLPSTLTFALGGLIAGAVVSLFLVETSPRRRDSAIPVAAAGVPEDVV
ncbi:MFS transporter [Burkholderia glumae]|uniref:MFS transporter n=1 Tax=Burkholderia glumae TaxID=337 RepID=UPI000F5F6914|nr:MFS transporter [Burkholderia glumae]MCQ0029997.1 MFS transporter [Burkholderia glumae]MCQ0035541.1 MFS transporter [Burkholderia glumae]QJW80757.1 MFS transporter [Burkholderia glumae]RQZ72045.1 MFS transporter [Burkholderia glumae]UVS84015.1 MFS transporter [Burkholderia glumae]